MADETGKQYETGVKFTVDSKEAEAASDRLKSKFSELSRATADVRNKIMGTARSMVSFAAGNLGLQLGLAGVVYQSFRANMELGVMQKNIAGAMVAFQHWKPAVDMVTRVKVSMRDAKIATQEFEEVESQLAVPMEQLGGAFRLLAGPAMGRYGMSMKETIELTKSAAAAAKVMGSDVGSVSQAISRLLETRQLRGVDPVTVFLRSAIGNVKELRKMAPDKLLGMVTEKLKGMTPAAMEMSQGLEGTMFRLKDFFEDTIRDIGGPTFKFIGQQLEIWRKKLDSASEGGKTLSQVLGEKVLSAVKAISTAVTFLADHWKIIVGAFAAFKLVGIVSQVATLTKALWGAVAAATALGAAGKLGGMGAGAAGLLRFAGPVGAGIGIGMLGVEVLKATGVWDKLLPEVKSEMLDKFRTHENFESRLDPTFKTAMGEELPMWLLKKGEKPEDYLPQTESLVSPKKQFNFNNFGPINVKQEFREADPDNVFIQFKEGLEGAAEKVTMSKQFSPFGPGVG